MEESLTGEETTHEAEEMKEEEEGKENEEIHPCTEEEANNSQQAGRLVDKILFVPLYLSEQASVMLPVNLHC